MKQSSLGPAAGIFERVLGRPRWDEERIRDEWFRVHFKYAAGMVGQWLGEVMDLEQADLLDFGCGDGITDLGVVLRFSPRSLRGVDVSDDHRLLPQAARRELGMRRLPANLRFDRIAPGSRLAGRFRADAVFSWSTFEHIDRKHLEDVTRDLHELLPRGGWFFLQIEPLYHSPFGSHLRRFVDVPWAHLAMDEEALWRAVEAHSGELRADEKDLSFDVRGADAYKRFIFDEYRKLNRLTADELVQLVRSAGFDIVKEERRMSDLVIPGGLLARFSEDDLRTNEIILLLRKP